MNKPLSYKDAGVDIDAGDALVERIKPLAKKTLRDGVLAGIGGFGALFEVPNPTHALRQDMTAQVAIVLDHAKSVLSIPTIALGIKAKDGRYTVRVVGADGFAADRHPCG